MKRSLSVSIICGLAAFASCAPGDPPARPDAGSELGFTYGDADAPVTVMEFSDYGCGYCQQFHLEIFPTIKREFIDTNMVNWTFVPFESGLFTGSRTVSAAVQCVARQAPTRFEEMNARMWAERRSWRRGPSPEAVGRALAERVGADLRAYDECIAADQAGEQIDHHSRVARRLGVRGTPTFFIDGYQPIPGVPTTETFRDILAAAHNLATRGR